MNEENKKLKDLVLSSREMILANLSMLSQIPAQTFHESDRAQFILQRFTESGVPEVKTDKMHNAFGVYNGKKNRATVMVFCHMDNQFDRSIDQNISINENKAYGAGIADDNIALAVMLTLPDVMRMAGIELDCNLILLATTRSHGRGDFEGIRTFIKDDNYKIDCAVNLSGLTLGTMNYFTRSRFRCDIDCKIPLAGEHPQVNIPTGHAILTINEIIENILKIPLPQKPWTNMNIGMVQGGERYSTPSRRASIHLEALSEDDQILDKLKDEIKSLVVDIGAKHGSNVTIDFFGTLKKSEITSRHPLVRHSIEILNELGYTPKMEYVNSEIAVTLSENISSVSLGITTGLGGSSSESYIDIPPITDGVVQLLNLINRIPQDSEIVAGC